MRSLKLLSLVLAAVALASCKGEGVEGPLAGCRTASSTSFCIADSECCSFGCVYGVCAPNPLEAGVCRTSADCAAPRFCVAGKCAAIACVGGGGSCAIGPCCSGTCTAGLCTGDSPPVARPGPANLAGATVPFRIPIQLSSSSFDPDNVPSNSGLTYTWSLVSGPPGASGAFDPSTSAVAPRFTPTVASATPYVIRLHVASGVLSHDATISFTAVNTAPEITMPADLPPDGVSTAYHSRNVPLAFSATVRDRDGGPITCSWDKRGPTGDFIPVSGPTVCAGASGVAATGTSLFTLQEDEAGTWELRLTVDDSVNPVVSVSRFVAVKNDPPVASAGPKRWGNYRLGPIPLAGTATDLNSDVTNLTVGDAAFTWEWRVTSAPAGSAQLGLVVGATPSIGFEPDSEGLFVLTLTADDHERESPNGTTGTSTVEVQVEPYILPLGEVADARYVDGAQRIALVETGAGNAYQLKIVDPTTLDVSYAVTLAAQPTVLGLNAAQTEATVGEVGGGWQRVGGIQGVPAVAATVPAGQGAPANLTDVVYASNCTYGMTGGGAVYYLDAAAPFAKSAICPNCTSGVNDPLATRGVAGQAGTSTWSVWLFRTTTGRLGRYDVNTSNCNLANPGTSFRTDGTVAGKEGFWFSADEQDLFTAWTTVYDARSATLAARVTTPFPLVPSHLATTLAGADLVAAVAQYGATALSTVQRTAVGGTFTEGAGRAYPVLGHNGDAVANFGRFAFVRAGGGAYYAIVRANVGTAAAPVYRWGLVNLGP